MQAPWPPAPDCMIVEPWEQPPTQALAVRDQRTTPTLFGRNKERMAETLGNRTLDLSLRHSAHKKKLTPERSGSFSSQSKDKLWDQTGPSVVEETDEVVTPSPSMRKILTRLQERQFLTHGGGALGTSGPVNKS